MKTIAIVINTSWNIFNFRLGLLKALQKEGYNIVAIAPKDEYSKKLEDLGIKHYDIKINNKGTNPFEDAKLVFAFRKLYKEINPDIILQYTIKPNIYGSMAAGMLGIPVISNISGLGTVFLNNSLSSKIARLLYKIALSTPKKVFFQNTHDKALFIDSKLVTKAQTGLLPGSGIDTEVFKPEEKQTIGNKIQFLCVARLVKDKGIKEYEAAARQLKQKYDNVEFAILGAYYSDNPTAISKKEIEAWKEEHIINYLGSNDDVRSVMLEADCIVLPSYREGLSRVLLEAGSLEKPIVTTDVPGCRDVVDDGVNGFLCQVRDAESLADAMEKILLMSEEERIAMGKKGRKKVIAEFDEKLVIEKYKEVITELIQ